MPLRDADRGRPPGRTEHLLPGRAGGRGGSADNILRSIGPGLWVARTGATWVGPAERLGRANRRRRFVAQVIGPTTAHALPRLDRAHNRVTAPVAGAIRPSTAGAP